MKVGIRIIIIIVLLVGFLSFNIWLVSFSDQALSEEIVIEQQHGTRGNRDTPNQIPIEFLCYVVWADDIEPQRHTWTYRNPLKRLLQKMRKLAKALKRVARHAQLKRERKAKFVEECSPPVEDIPAVESVPKEEPLIGKKRGKKATILTNHFFCPDKDCKGYGQIGPHPNHQIVGCGIYKTFWGKIRHMLKCNLCGKRFSETRGTVFFGLKTPEETVYRTLAALAEGVSIRSTSRIFQVKVETILLWLKLAGEHCEKVSNYLIRNLHIEQAQLDELWTFVYKKQKKLSEWEKLHTEWGDTWIWTVFDPIHKLVLAFLIGDREEAQAEGVLKRLKARLIKGCLPLFTSDHLPHYAKAILKVMGRWVQPKRKGLCGRFPKKQLEPPDDLEYAIVHKERQKGRIISITTKVVFGKIEHLLARLHASGMNSINTSFVERMNLSLRHLISRLRRKGLTFSKKQKFLKWHMHLAVAYYHFVLTHRSLRRRLTEPIPTKGNGSPKIWEMRTPAMSAGLTDNIWSMQELLMFRVPIIPAASA
jgi:IS1 family transposase